MIDSSKMSQSSKNLKFQISHCGPEQNLNLPPGLVEECLSRTTYRSPIIYKMPLCPIALPQALPPALLAGVVLHLARGFGTAKEGSPKQNGKKLRGKVLPCPTCKGTGNKPCQFCQGTTLMVGFLGKKVPCVPCQGKATLGRPCVDCGGMGFFTP